MTSLTFYDDLDKIKGQGYLDRGEQMKDEAWVFKKLNDTVIERFSPETIGTIADAYFTAIGSMKNILENSYNKDIRVNNVGDQLSPLIVRRHKVATMQLFSELNATRIKIGTLILQCAEDPTVRRYLERLAQGTLKSRRVLLLSQCLNHINTVTWPYNIVITDWNIVELYDNLLGANYGKKVPETIGRIMDCFADADAQPASP
jgi:hypothetical protein